MYGSMDQNSKTETPETEPYILGNMICNRSNITKIRGKMDYLINYAGTRVIHM